MRTSVKLVVVLAAVALLLAATVVAKKYRSQSDDLWLGINYVTVDDKVAERYDLKQDYGVYVKRVIDDSPADEVGLERGDVIVAFDGQKVVDGDDLTDLLADFEEGEDVSLEYYRGDDRISVEVELAERPSRSHRAFAYAMGGPDNVWQTIRDDKGYIGVKLQGLSRQLGEYFGVERGRGALVTEVVEDSPAAQGGLKAGDVIIEIDKARVVEVDDVVDDIGDMEPGEKAEIKVMRNKKEQTLSVEIGERGDYDTDYGYSWSDDDDFVWWDEDDDNLIFHGGQGWHGLAELEALKELKHLRIPDVPDVPAPHIFRYYDHESDWDSGELDEEMEQLQQELKELKRELKDLRSKLD